MPVIVQSEGAVAVLTVAQWGQRGQTGVIFRLGGYQINWGLRCTAAVGKIRGPLGLTHQAFGEENGQEKNDVSQSHSPLIPSHLVKSLH